MLRTISRAFQSLQSILNKNAFLKEKNSNRPIFLPRPLRGELGWPIGGLSALAPGRTGTRPSDLNRTAQKRSGRR
jgi:hypothetical protein